MAMIAGLAVVLVLGGALLWVIIDGLIDEVRHHREIARIRDESRGILIRMYGRR